MDENQATAPSSPDPPKIREWPPLQLTLRFFAGFTPASWRRAAQGSIDEDLGQVDRISEAFPQAKVDFERVKEILRRRQPLREDQARIRKLSNRIATLWALATFAVVPLVSVRVFHIPHLDVDFFMSYLVQVLAMLFLAFLPTRPRKRSFSFEAVSSAANSAFFGSGYAALTASALIISGYLTLAWFMYRTAITRPDPRSSAIMVAALCASVALVVILFAWAFATTARPQALERYWAFAHPDAVVVSSLVDTLFMLSLDRDVTLSVVGGRVRLCGLLWRYLDRASEAVRAGLPGLLGRSDPVSPATPRVVLGIAAGLQDLKNDVERIVSREESAEKDKSLDRILHALDTWAAGGIDELPHAVAEPVAVAAPRGVQGLRRVIAAIAPLLVLGLIRFLPFHSAELTGVLTTFSVLWLISAVLRGLLGEDYEKNLDATTKLSGLQKGKTG